MRRYMPKREPLDFCPVERTLSYISAKWTVRIFYLISLEPIHFNALLRSFPGLTREVLAARIKALSEAGFVGKKEEGSLSLYFLTERGRNFIPVLEVMSAWGEADFAAEKKTDLPFSGEFSDKIRLI